MELSDKIYELNHTSITHRKKWEENRIEEQEITKQRLKKQKSEQELRPVAEPKQVQTQEKAVTPK